jgi:hypothetical protein
MIALLLSFFLTLLPYWVWGQALPFPGPGAKTYAGALATDNFNRANASPIGAPWTTVTNMSAMAITSNTAVPSAYGSDCAAYNTSATWPANQYAQVTIATTIPDGGPGQGHGPVVRASTSAQTMYILGVSTGRGRYTVAKFNAGSYSTLVADAVQAWAISDVVRLEVTGSGPVTLKVFRNGTQVGSNITDSSSVITTGNAGIGYTSTTTSGSVDNFEGGSL